MSGTATAEPEPAAASTAAAPPSSAATTPPPRVGLLADVLGDECLLDAEQFEALLGRPVAAPEQREAHGPGASGSSCYADAAGADGEPLAAVNVYLPRAGDPAERVRDGPPGSRRFVADAGEVAAVLDTDTGPTLQIASPRYLVTIAVRDGGEPTDEQWRAAATAALNRLP